ncbi:amino acid ABC transporter permease [Bordetella tumulicola]|uniref:amino acid ABC transporter permease n=1 Tax=Bordetella tumulicola TaxID=1649133 RepID=UPI0039EEF81B
MGNTSFNLAYLGYMLQGAAWTVGLSAMGFLGGGILGGIIALARISRRTPVRWAASLYIQLIQGIPLLILMFLFYFGLGLMGYNVPPLAAAGGAMSVYASAYLGDIWRGCLQAVPRSQWEAAECLGLSPAQRMVCVIVPQAMRLATPSTVGFLVQIVKNTSLASVVGFVELVRAGQMVNNTLYEPFMVFSLMAVLYFALCYPLSRWSHALERRLKTGRRARATA